MILAFSISGPIIDKLGYKRSFLLFFSLAIISAVLYVVVPNKG